MHPSNQSENQISLYGLKESEFQQVIDYGLNVFELGDFDEQKISWGNWCFFAKIAIKHVNQEEKKSAQEFFSHMLNELDKMSSEAWVEMEVFPSKLPNNLFIKARKACVNYLQCLDVPNPYSDSGRRENIIENLKQYNSHTLFEQWQEKYMKLFDTHLINFIENKEESVPEHIALQEPSDNKLLVEENKKLRALFWKKDLAYSELLQKKNEQNTIPQEESETFSWLMEINTTLNAQLEEQNLAYSELFQKNSELNSQVTEKENHLNKLNTELELQKSLNTNLKARLGKIVQETKGTTVQLHEAEAQLTDKDAQLRALQAQLDSKDAQLRALQALLDSKDTPQTLIQAKNINSQEQTQERIEELIPTPMPIRQESSFIAISEDQNVSDEPEQKSEIVPAQHTEDRKIVDNSGEGNCMYYAYGISLMYYLRSKNDEDLSETVFNRLNLKNKEKEQLKTLLFKDKRQHFSDSSIKLVIEPIFNRAARSLVAKQTEINFKKDPKSTSLFAAAHYKLNAFFLEVFQQATNHKHLSELIEHQPNVSNFEDAEIYRLDNIEQNMHEFASQQLESIVNSFQGEVIKAAQGKTKDDCKRKKEIMNTILWDKTVEFFKSNENKYLNQYTQHLQKNGVWASEEELMLLHCAVQNEYWVREADERVTFVCENPINLHIYTNNQPVIGCSGIPELIMNNQGNYHWYSIIPEAQLMIIKPKETNNTEITLASASNHSNKFFDSQKQDSDYSQKLSTENTLKPK